MPIGKLQKNSPFADTPKKWNGFKPINSMKYSEDTIKNTMMNSNPNLRDITSREWLRQTWEVRKFME